MKKTFFIILMSNCCFSQNDSIAPYFKEFENKISTQLFVLNNTNNFTITTQDQEVELNPNYKTTLNIGFQYDIISFSIGFAPRFFADNRDNRNSKMRTLSFGFFPGSWVQQFEYHNQKGISLEPVNTPYRIYLEELESLKIGGSTHYFFNKNFSYRAMALQNFQQLKSAGSFSLGLAYNYTELDGNNGPLLDAKIHFIDIAFTPAYYYNWVVGKHVNLAGGISLGTGINFSNDDGHKTNSLLYTSGILLAPGFNSEKWFFGMNLKANYFGRKISEDASVGDTVATATLFVGYRFDAPQLLVSKTQKLKNILKKS